MCGIFLTNDPLIDDSSLNVIEKTLRFRGPDGSSGLIEHNGWRAYHSRLSIIDLASGVNQPVLDVSGGLMVFNGEILNYKELGWKYFDREYISDTLLLNDLVAFNKLVLDELDGFFAFAYVSAFGELSHCARDKFGVKPIYYYLREEFITISSEPNTLRKLFDLGVNQDAVEEYLSVRAPILSGSYFYGVSVVEPGCCFVNGEYFNPLNYLVGSYEDVSIDDLKAALLKGISTRKVSDARIGLLLSRGVDSNLIKELGVFDRFYSTGFEGDGDLEYLKSQSIENLTLDSCNAAAYRKEFNELLTLRGEPMSVPNEVLLYRVSKIAAKDGVKVLLSGEGADEFFGGYDRIFQWAYNTEKFDFDKFIGLYCYAKPDDDSLFYKRLSEVFNRIELPNVFEMVRWFFVRYHLPVLFRRLDFSLMAAGIEGREPIANIHTFKLAAKMSPDVLMGNKLGKLPLRKLISEYKGCEFAYEEKIGFPVDLKLIFKKSVSDESYGIWFEENLKVLT